MSEVIITGEPPEIPGAIAAIQKQLYHKWATTTGHGDIQVPFLRWACEIYYGCQTCNGQHLSIPCSLSREAYLVGQFLQKEWTDEEFWLFFKMYLFMLDEFGDDLARTAQQLGLTFSRRPPVLVSSWCNNFAKHRLAVLIQHHPILLVADSYGDKWPEFKKALPDSKVVDTCGNQRPIQVIDHDWFCRERATEFDLANGEKQAVIVVPPLMEFLDGTIGFFRSFVDACKSESELVKRFESQHVASGCYGW